MKNYTILLKENWMSAELDMYERQPVSHINTATITLKMSMFVLDVKQYLYCPILHYNTDQSSSPMQSLTDHSEVTENKLQ